MTSMTFQINDASTGGNSPAVWVTVTESGDGSLSFSIRQQGGVVGDLRGLFFDIADESILKSLTVSAASSDIRVGNDSVKDLGNGANMNGLLGSDGGYDVGIEIGTAGIGKDDVQAYTFKLASAARALTLKDLANVDFAARLTSVGVVGGCRADSAKILEITSQAIDSKNDIAQVQENGTVSGNVFSNDVVGGGINTVKAWSAGAIGGQISLTSNGDVIGTLRLNANGSYVLDASAADELSAGEQIVYEFTYGARNQTELTSWSDDTAAFKVIINGVNDGPVANADTVSIQEDGSPVSVNVLSNDLDVDRGDAISIVSIASGSSETVVTRDGSVLKFDVGFAYQGLGAGETATETHAYVISDKYGATSSATVTVVVTGTNDGPVANADTGAAVEDGPAVVLNVMANDTDIDAGDTKTIVSVSGGAAGTVVSTDGATVSYSTGTAFQSLGAGETTTDTLSYVMVDSQGATSSAAVTVTITGTNDAVTLGGPSSGAVTEDATAPLLSAVGSLAFGDVDSTDTHAASALKSGGSLGGSLELTVNDNVNGAGSGSAGRVDWTYAVANESVQHLGAGETASETFVVAVSDGQGGDATQSVTVVVTGVNDIAQLTGVSTGSVVEDDVMRRTAFGALRVDDVDQGQSTFADGTSSIFAGTYGAFSFDAGTGEWVYTLDNADFDTDELIDGQKTTDSFTVWSLDGSASRTVTVTIDGATDDRGGGDDDSGCGCFGDVDLESYSVIKGTDGDDVLFSIQNETPTFDGNDGNGPDAIFGDGGGDIIIGGRGKDVLCGGSGNDVLYGGDRVAEANGDGSNDVLVGGAGNDTLVGGLGYDTLTGCEGNDVFLYRLISSNEGDTITDFVAGEDKIDLSALDADTARSGRAGDQSFAYADNNGPANHSVWWFEDAANNVTVIRADTNGALAGANQGAELQIMLVGVNLNLDQNDFAL